MKWSDLMSGDVVIPRDPYSPLWVVLSVAPDKDELTIAHLDTGQVEVSGGGYHITFHLGVQILREGENINR